MSAIEFAAIEAAFKKLPASAAADLIKSVNGAIRDTGGVFPSGRDDDGGSVVSVAALARHLYYHALKLGAARHQHSGDSDDEGSTTLVPQYKTLMEQLTEFRKNFGFPGTADPRPKDVDNLCQHKVRRSTLQGFYALVALFILYLSGDGYFDQPFFQQLVPPGETDLSEVIGRMFAYRLNAAAVTARTKQPFDGMTADRSSSDYPEAHLRLVLKRQRADDANRFFEEYRLAEDGHAHFVIYRARRSNPNELIKSFLAIKPFTAEEAAAGSRYMESLHIYQAPQDVGRTRRSTPGRAVPLESGVFVIGGQREEAMRQPDEIPGKSREPFRALEMLYFPWHALSVNHLFVGLCMTVNNEGLPIVGRICARPTLIQWSTDIELGNIALADLAGAPDIKASLGQDQLREQAKAAENELGARGDQFLQIYEEFGSREDLAARIAEKCNNAPGGWALPGGFVDKAGNELDSLAFQTQLGKAFRDFSRDGQRFSFWTDTRFPPLVSEDGR